MTKPFLKNFQNPLRKEATSQGINSSRYSTQKKKLVFLGEGNDEIRVKFYTVVRSQHNLTCTSSLGQNLGLREG